MDVRSVTLKVSNMKVYDLILFLLNLKKHKRFHAFFKLKIAQYSLTWFSMLASKCLRFMVPRNTLMKTHYSVMWKDKRSIFNNFKTSADHSPNRKDELLQESCPIWKYGCCKTGRIRCLQARAGGLVQFAQSPSMSFWADQKQKETESNNKFYKEFPNVDILNLRCTWLTSFTGNSKPFKDSYWKFGRNV